MYHYSFEKLEVWQLSRKLVGIIYKITDKFPAEEKFGLTNQLRRASVSIASNIAEGSSRNSLKDQVRFIEIAYGSLMEVYTQLCISIDLSYASKEEMQEVNLLIKELSNKLNALSKAYKQQINN
jgi:four helix bundle protein